MRLILDLRSLPDLMLCPKSVRLPSNSIRFVQINSAISWSNSTGRPVCEVSLGTGTSFDLDFHTIPYHGDDAFTEKHFVSTRSSSQKEILSLVVRDIDARLLIYVDVRQNNRQQQLMQYVGF